MSVPPIDYRRYIDLIRRLDGTQRAILESLRDRGPGLAMDIAVRVLLFPDEIAAPLHTLQELGLVQARPFTGSSLGAEIYSLTREGEQVVRLLRDPEFMEQLREPAEEVAPARSAAPPFDPRQAEIDLLRRLGDLAAKRGDDASAEEYYKKALDLTRSLTGSS
ncbi:tetratricopeptide repeat protein [Litorilinea aerophila]|uniref:Tetratricopeptide repeat protein n=1 Tax=Litorilinea aerophila TaxID=1204385 RepID=A0A540VGN8_9CHLR|nr:tetratricopeptide repeat protein [Litorilinea aerophila]MCC9076310.1 tetratricopeptide repeat protein [Litorilinea aerophila]OUC05563.1 hypothetical protein RY27_26535 [Litorilinea aerophila]GIV80613.1 MAG: hypothetical protein KatS3mg050_5007 [Litorilinea sp.]